MKYTQMLDVNMVPEWRNQYLDYHSLDAALNKAIESKNMKTREKGVDMYFELIKFNQKFANFFNRECQAQLDKINSFHKEKLSEMSGKFNNLQSQLDQVLSSAVFREVQPQLSSHYNIEPSAGESSNSSNYNTVTSISELFRNFRCNTARASIDGQQDIEQHPQRLINNLIPKLNSSLNSCPNNTLRRASQARFNTEKMSIMARKFSESFTNSSQKLSANIRLAQIYRQNHNRFSFSNQNDRPGGSTPFSGDFAPELHSNPRRRFEHLKTLSGTNTQSKKKIISFYKKKMTHLKFAFRELYFNLVLFEQYTQLNHNGFEQILRKHDRMFASSFGRNFYEEHIQTADFYNDLQAIDRLIENVEHIYTLHFENGNRRKAIEKLQVPSTIYKPSSAILDFRVGYELGAFSVLFLLVVLIGFLSDTGYDWRTVFRLYRSPLVLIIFLFKMGISIIIWKYYKINHVLIFELNPRNNLSSQHFVELASALGIIWCVSVIMFLFSSKLGIKPSICPLMVVMIIVFYLLNPTQTCHYQARFWLLKILGRIFTAPFCPVRFADFWVADQLVSIVPLFLDLEFLACFYTTGDIFSVHHLSSDYASRCVTRNPQDLLIRTVVAALPAWFRCAQCLRRWRDENWLRLHICNAGKYWCMVMVVVLSSVSQYKKNTFELDTMRIIWIVAAIFTSSLTAYWDIIYDFGLFNQYDTNEEDESRSQTNRSSEANVSTNLSDIFSTKAKRKKNRQYPFLRKELIYPVWVYYFAIVENIILRFGWIITISLTEFSGLEAGLTVSLLAPMEMFRRFVWNCIRLENEQLNNCGLFRAVRDIPIEVVAPVDESHLDKVIMMMDSRDGPSMRNRLMKRRTLRPDRASFLVLQKRRDSLEQAASEGCNNRF